MEIEEKDGEEVGGGRERGRKKGGKGREGGRKKKGEDGREVDRMGDSPWELTTLRGGDVCTSEKRREDEKTGTTQRGRRQTRDTEEVGTVTDPGHAKMDREDKSRVGVRENTTAEAVHKHQN